MGTIGYDYLSFYLPYLSGDWYLHAGTIGYDYLIFYLPHLSGDWYLHALVWWAIIEITLELNVNPIMP